MSALSALSLFEIQSDGRAVAAHVEVEVPVRRYSEAHPGATRPRSEPCSVYLQWPPSYLRCPPPGGASCSVRSKARSPRSSRVRRLRSPRSRRVRTLPDDAMRDQAMKLETKRASEWERRVPNSGRFSSHGFQAGQARLRTKMHL